MTIRDLEPADIARRLEDHSIILIDVREPNEYLAERIPGALLFPLSTVDPKALPDNAAKPVVFHCGSGMRSAKAMAASQGIACEGHMKGGIKAWKAAGLPTVTAD